MADTTPNPPTIADIQSILWTEVQRIQAGETSAANVNAIANATGKILSAVKLQMEFYRLTGKTLPDLPLLR